jgi:hypothetical protein
MGLEAKVAVANMALINCALAIILYDVRIQSEGSRAAAEVALFAVWILGFPVGWIATFFCTMGGPDPVFFTLLAVFLTLNAYVWGKTVEVIVRRHKAHRDRRLSGDQESPCP